MATAILRPNGTVSNPGPWTVTGAATAHAAVNEAVTQPTAGSTSENVNTATAGRVLTLDIDTQSGVDYVTQAVIWIYANTAGNDRITVGLTDSAGNAIGSTTTHTLTGTNTWYSATISNLALTQAMLDGLRLVLTSSASGGMSTVTCYTAYVEITYTAPPTWPSYTAGSYPQAVVDTAGLRAYWRLGESSGTTAEEEGNRFDGTTSGATVNQAGLLASGGNTAYSFDGTNDSVITSTSPAFSWGLFTPFSFEFWWRSSALPASSDTFLGNSPCYIYYTAGGKIAFERSVGTPDTVTSTTSPATNTTYHIVGTYDGTTMKLYINGTQEGGDVAGSHSMGAGGTYVFSIGAFNSNPTLSNWAPGVIDEVAVYSVAISSSTITDHYTKGTTAGTTSTRTVPQTAAISTPYKTRIVPQTAALSTADKTRTIGQSAAVKTVDHARTVPETAAISSTLIRTVPETAAISATATRTIPQTTILTVADITRTIPQSAAIKTIDHAHAISQDAAIQTTRTRTVGQTAAIQTERTRTISQVASVKVTGITRIVTQSAAVASNDQTRAIPLFASISASKGISIDQAAAISVPGSPVREVPQAAAISTVDHEQAIPQDAALQTTLTRVVAQAAALRRTLTRTVPQTAAIQRRLTRTIPQTARISVLVTRTRTIGQTVALRRTRTRTIPQSVALRKSEPRTIPQTASLDVTIIFDVDLDAGALPSSFGARAFASSFRAKAFPAASNAAATDTEYSAKAIPASFNAKEIP